MNLCQMGFAWIDCQLPNPHLTRLGALAISRARFVRLVARPVRCTRPQHRTPSPGREPFVKAEDTSGKLAFYATPPHQCSYLPARDATTLFADPRFPKDLALYTMLSRNGFRRSGEHIYRPHCAACQACIPIRVPVQKFKPRRSQRRAWQRNRDLYVLACEPRLRDDHFALYHRYINARHRNGGMDNPTPGAIFTISDQPLVPTPFSTSSAVTVDYWRWR